MHNLVEIGARLRQVRRDVKENQTIFAKRGGVGLQTQSRYEAAETEPGALYLARLAESGIDVLYVLTGGVSGERLHPIQTSFLRMMNGLSLEDCLLLHRIGLGLGEVFKTRVDAEIAAEADAESSSEK